MLLQGPRGNRRLSNSWRVERERVKYKRVSPLPGVPVAFGASDDLQEVRVYSDLMGQPDKPWKERDSEEEDETR